MLVVVDDADYEKLVQMSVALVEDVNDGESPFELVFGIRFTNIETGVISGPFFDHDTARQYVPKDRAAQVMDLIVACVNRLLDEVAPSVVAMETFEANLPAVAMGKYMRICNVMGLNSYAQTEYRRDETDGKDHWLFTK